MMRDPTLARGGERHRNLVRLAALLLAGYTVRVAGDWQGWHLPDFLNLPIHETGHLVFAWGGAQLAALGGTLGQLLLPLVFAVHFWRRRDPVGTGSMIWWCGQSGINVARYIADARAQVLPLVGGGEHDWTYLLGEWGLLARDGDVARSVRTLAVGVMVLGIWWMLRPIRSTTDPAALAGSTPHGDFSDTLTGSRDDGTVAGV
jgi:hypothetical protein